VQTSSSPPYTYLKTVTQANMSSSAASSAMANPVEAEAEMIFGSNLGYWLGPIILG
jgi:hypothetical protein